MGASHKHLFSSSAKKAVKSHKAGFAELYLVAVVHARP
jgi:hypothetical protein